MKRGSKWRVTPTVAAPILGPDTIHAYLAEPPISPHQLLTFGGFDWILVSAGRLNTQSCENGVRLLLSTGYVYLLFFFGMLFDLISSQRRRSTASALFPMADGSWDLCSTTLLTRLSAVRWPSVPGMVLRYSRLWIQPSKYCTQRWSAEMLQ